MKKVYNTLKFFRYIPNICSGLSAFLGLVVLVGWYINNATLIQVFPIFVPMQFNTALGFLVCGIGVLLQSYSRNRLAMACGLIAVVIGFLTLLQYVFNVNFGIDQLLMEHYITVETSHPGRMAPNTALCFGFSGTALLFLSKVRRTRQDLMVVGVLGSITLALGVVSFFGYLSGVETAYGWGNLTQMAVHTAAGFFTLGMGLFTFAWIEGIVEDTWIPDWIALPAGIGMITIALTEWQALIAKLGSEYVALPVIVLISGLLMTVLLIATIHLAQISWRRAKVVERVNTELERKINEHKQAEEALRESENKFRSFAEQSIVGIYILQDGVFKYVNPRFSEIFGYTVAECLDNLPFQKLVYDEDSTMVEEQVEKRIKNEEKSKHYEFRGLKKNREIISIEIFGSSIEVNDRRAAIGTLLDITESKQAEEQIKTSLKEKETLLKEIHHRVKNNLTVVSSLLKLQASSMEDERLKEALKESQNRIFAMSAVHETLHGSENLSNINLNSYIPRITSSIFQTYSVNPAKVTLKNDVEEVSFNINQASPLGLVINELISNSLKYAFPDDRTGEITVNLEQNEKELQLIVMDDGVGMSKEFDWKNPKTLGLKLVRTLVENQLDGSIDMESNNGTKFTIKLNIEI